MAAFSEKDHARILACLTEDVEWVIPPEFHGHGKAAFEKEIDNENFTGKPDIKETRMVEENDVVVVEGSVKAQFKAGGFINILFCDVFEMKDGKIKKLTSYLVPLKQ